MAKLEADAAAPPDANIPSARRRGSVNSVMSIVGNLLPTLQAVDANENPSVEAIATPVVSTSPKPVVVVTKRPSVVRKRPSGDRKSVRRAISGDRRSIRKAGSGESVYSVAAVTGIAGSNHVTSLRLLTALDKELCDLINSDILPRWKKNAVAIEKFFNDEPVLGHGRAESSFFP